MRWPSRATLRRLFGNVAVRVCLAALLLYTVYHCVGAFSDRVQTEVVRYGTASATYRATATLVRDEQVVSVAGGRTLCSYTVENGAKINQASSPVELYTLPSADRTVELQASLWLLDAQLRVAAALPRSAHLSSLPSVQSDVSRLLVQNAATAAKGDSLASLSSGAFELLLSLDRLETLTTGKSEQQLISSLRYLRSQLLSSALSGARTMTMTDMGSDASGAYFFYASSVDGYENIFSYSSLANISADAWRAAAESAPTVYPSSTTVVGKLVYSHRWSIVLPVTNEIAASLSAGESYQVRMLDEDALTLSMTLARLLESDEGGTSYAVLTCSVMPEGFSYPRFPRVELVLSTAQGYRIPETALRTVDGQSGVFILSEGRVCFRTIEILQSGQGYAIVYAPTDEQRRDDSDTRYDYAVYLDLHDVVITDGRELYDGKLIR